MENQKIIDTVQVPASVRSALLSLNATLNAHEETKARLQDKLANPLVSDMDCHDQYKQLILKTESMIQLLQKEISKTIELL